MVTKISFAEMETREGYRFMIEGGRPSEYSISSCGAYLGVDHERAQDDYPWCNASATVLDGNRARAAYHAAERAALPRHAWYDAFEIEGLGVYVLCPPNSGKARNMLDGDHPVLMPVDGGNACGQAAKRCRMSAAADAKRPIPQYDNT
jgi:hypothetical protein